MEGRNVTGRSSVVRDVALLAAATAFMLALIFIVFLSSALFVGTDSILSATVLAVAFAMGAAVVLVAVFVFQPDATGTAFLAVGLALELCASVVALLVAFQGTYEQVLFAAFGFVLGAGVALIVLYLGACLVEFEASRIITWAFAAFAGAVVIFLAYAALVPVALAARALVVLALCSALLFGLFEHVRRRDVQAGARDPATLSTLSRGRMSDLFSHKLTLPFACLSGFMFGYCYNAYPKTEHLLGGVGYAVFDIVNVAAIVLVCLYACVIPLATGIQKLTGSRSSTVFGTVLLVLLAILYLLIPSMATAASLLFVLLNSLAAAVALLPFSAFLFTLSSGKKQEALREVVVFVLGGTLGAIVAAVFVATTVEDPFIVLPKAARDFIIQGTPAVGFVVLASMFLAWAQEVFFPAALPYEHEGEGAEEADELAAPEQVSRTMAEAFRLTPREEEVLGLLLQGRSGPYIAEDLHLAKSTVKTHIRHIYEKCGVSSRQELIDLSHAMPGSAGA